MEDPSGADADSADAGIMPLVAARVASAPAPAHRLRTVRRETPRRSARVRRSNLFWCMALPFRGSVTTPMTKLRHPWWCPSPGEHMLTERFDFGTGLRCRPLLRGSGTSDLAGHADRNREGRTLHRAEERASTIARAALTPPAHLTPMRAIRTIPHSVRFSGSEWWPWHAPRRLTIPYADRPSVIRS